MNLSVFLLLCENSSPRQARGISLDFKGHAKVGEAFRREVVTFSLRSLNEFLIFSVKRNDTFTEVASCLDAETWTKLGMIRR